MSLGEKHVIDIGQENTMMPWGHALLFQRGVEGCKTYLLPSHFLFICEYTTNCAKPQSALLYSNCLICKNTKSQGGSTVGPQINLSDEDFFRLNVLHPAGN